jgi:hypothetical protein
VVASSFFINTRNHHLPVVSISTQPANLTDNTIGIYVVGTNGITGNGNSTPVNFNQPWDRPANFELFDTSGVSCLNQELDISIAGAYTRNNPQKSLKIQPRKKFGDSQLRYDFFPNAKPNRKYKDILLRNSGNDFYYSMMRDGFIQTLVSKRMDLDVLAYQPAVFYLNANYWGIQNLREESSSDFLYSNYGLEDDQVNLLETGEIPDNALYKPLRDFVSGNDMTKASIYDRVCQLMDVDQFINYMISEIYIGNTDWPYNNVKIWRKKDGGKWRWILYDTDFGFGLYDSNLHNHNTLLYALGEKADQLPPDWSTLLLRRLMLNETFRNKFLDRFSIQISSTFETNRVNAIMDSLASKIAGEIDYHRTRWFIRNRSFAEELGIMKTFSAQRPDLMMGFLSSRFANSAPIRTVQLSSNVTGASYRMNTEAVMDSEVRLKYFKGRKLELQANPVFGYRFKQWETLGTQNQELVQMGAIWKYFDGAAIPASNWNTTAYSDAVWKSGPSQLGYGNKGEKTLISYGNDANAKYTTAYFRKTVSITDLPRKDNFSITMIVDDGAAVYVNGHEVGRHLLAAGALTFNTFSTAANNSDTVTFSVPSGYLREGDNLIAVEVHQTSLFSSDCVFNLKMTCNVSGTTSILTDPVFSVILDNDVKLQAIYEKTTTELPKEEATIVLNELVASNNTYPDEFGVREDYIELYNTGDKDVNVAGWYLSDTPANRTLWQIPVNDLSKTLVPAKGRIVFWADNEPLQGTMHLGFKLGKEGETVLLARKDLSGSVLTVDSVSYPALDVNLSYSRIPDGGPNWYADLPTFQAKNNDIVAIGQPKTEVLSTVELYPTLVTEAFTVCHATGKTIILTDLTGKRMLSRQCLTDETVVEAGFLQPGLYLVNIGNQRFKIIKR